MLILATHSDAGCSTLTNVRFPTGWVGQYGPTNHELPWRWISPTCGRPPVGCETKRSRRFISCRWKYNTPQTQWSDRLTDDRPMSLACILWKEPPTSGFVKMPANILSVGMWCNHKSPLLMRSITKKYLILICVVLAAPWLFRSSIASTGRLSSATFIGPIGNP